MLRCLLPIGLLAASGCSTLDYDAAPVGRFEGSALVVWVGPGDEDVLGDGRFLYVPRLGDELVFYRSDAADASEGNEVIRPGPFYTDGGSIPRSVQNIRGYNAWAFGPAYIVHDWLFVVRKCANDDDPEALADPIAGMTFRESAEIMAETIKTVSAQYDIAPETEQAGRVVAPITFGPISRGLWDLKGACAEQKVSEAHMAIVEDINGGRGEAITVTPDGVDDPGADLPRSAPQVRVPPYVVVGTIAFGGQ